MAHFLNKGKSMLLSLALVAQLFVAHLSPSTSSARLLPATEYTPHHVWAPFVVGGVSTVGGGLVVLAVMLLVRGDVWVTAGIGALGGLAAIAILVVSAAFAIAYAIDNAAHRSQSAPLPAPMPESSRVLEPGSPLPSSVVFRF